MLQQEYAGQESTFEKSLLSVADSIATIGLAQQAFARLREIYLDRNELGLSVTKVGILDPLLQFVQMVNAITDPIQSFQDIRKASEQILECVNHRDYLLRIAKLATGHWIDCQETLDRWHSRLLARHNEAMSRQADEKPVVIAVPTVGEFLESANALLRNQSQALASASTVPSPQQVKEFKSLDDEFCNRYVALLDEYFPGRESTRFSNATQLWGAIQFHWFDKVKTAIGQTSEATESRLLEECSSIIDLALRFSILHKRIALTSLTEAINAMNDVSHCILVSECDSGSMIAMKECTDRFERFVRSREEVERVYESQLNKFFDFGWNMRSTGIENGEYENTKGSIGFCARLQGLASLINNLGDPSIIRRIAERIRKWFLVTSDGRGWNSPLINSHPLKREVGADRCFPPDYIDRIRSTGCAAELLCAALDGFEIPVLQAIVAKSPQNFGALQFDELHWQYNRDDGRTTEPVPYVPKMICGTCGYEGPVDARTPIRCPVCTPVLAPNADTAIEYMLSGAERWISALVQIREDIRKTFTKDDEVLAVMFQNCREHGDENAVTSENFKLDKWYRTLFPADGGGVCTSRIEISNTEIRTVRYAYNTRFVEIVEELSNVLSSFPKVILDRVINNRSRQWIDFVTSFGLMREQGCRLHLTKGYCTDLSIEKHLLSTFFKSNDDTVEKSEDGGWYVSFELIDATLQVIDHLIHPSTWKQRSVPTSTPVSPTDKVSDAPQSDVVEVDHQELWNKVERTAESSARNSGYHLPNAVLAFTDRWCNAMTTDESSKARWLEQNLAESFAYFRLAVSFVNANPTLLTDLKYGPRKLMDVFLSINELFHRGIKFEQPIDVSQIRALMEANGLPHKPNDVLGICEMVEEYFTDPNRTDTQPNSGGIRSTLGGYASRDTNGDKPIILEPPPPFSAESTDWMYGRFLSRKIAVSTADMSTYRKNSSKKFNDENGDWGEDQIGIYRTKVGGTREVAYFLPRLNSLYKNKLAHSKPDMDSLEIQTIPND